MTSPKSIPELRQAIAAIEHREVIRVHVSRRPAVRTCRVCGCTDNRACVDAATGDACYWVDKDLCSACEGKG
jgi:hypothetical protein